MKTLLINSHDKFGGAARAAYRLHKGFLDNAIDSRMLVGFKSSDEVRVKGPVSKVQKLRVMAQTEFEPLLLKYIKGGAIKNFSPAWLPSSMLHQDISHISPDIVHLHWMCGGLFRLEQIGRIKKPMVWTLHDMWPFTGGCHYDEGCEKYKVSCGECPQLKRSCDSDLSHSVWSRKRSAWKGSDITLVAPSNWLAECARNSTLFQGRRIEVIPNGIDLDLFKPVNRELARDILGLPKDKKLIIFGAMNATTDDRKGFDLLLKGIQGLQKSDDIELVIFGASEPLNPPEFGLPVHYMGVVNDDTSLVLLYSSSDVMVISSRQDNLPNTVVESMACGVPSVAFNVGGLVDLIEHKTTGYLADAFNVSDITKGIEWILGDSERYLKLCEAARERAENLFDINLVVKQYSDVYKSII